MATNLDAKQRFYHPNSGDEFFGFCVPQGSFWKHFFFVYSLDRYPGILFKVWRSINIKKRMDLWEWFLHLVHLKPLCCASGRQPMEPIIGRKNIFHCSFGSYLDCFYKNIVWHLHWPTLGANALDQSITLSCIDLYFPPLYFAVHSLVVSSFYFWSQRHFPSRHKRVFCCVVLPRSIPFASTNFQSTNS